MAQPDGMEAINAVVSRMITPTSNDDHLKTCIRCKKTEEEVEFEGSRYSEHCKGCAAIIRLEVIRSSIPTTLKASGVPQRFINSTLENYRAENQSQEAAVESLKRFSDLNNGESVFITSKRSGTGKTHLACATLSRTLYNGNKNISFISSSQIFVKLRSTFRQESGTTEEDIIKKFTERKVLVIDDIGVEKVTDWTLQTWYTIIDIRYSELLPTIYTSNLSIGEIAGAMDSRLASRLASGIVLTIEGKDQRI